ncbi:hypothetical protein [Lutibacter sp.]|uniref:hypothetical protein n=1 Tax=Lutibacter sp. TaxID=1925666 RepID=UPI003563F791
MIYTREEVETIVNNCKNETQLLTVCQQFKFLIDNKYQVKSLHLNVITQLKLRQLLKGS